MHINLAKSSRLESTGFASVMAAADVISVHSEDIEVSKLQRKRYISQICGQFLYIRSIYTCTTIST